MFEKYLQIISDFKDKNKQIKDFLKSVGLGEIDFSLNKDSIIFQIPSSYKLKMTSKKEEIIFFLKSLNINKTNLN